MRGSSGSEPNQQYRKRRAQVEVDMDLDVYFGGGMKRLQRIEVRDDSGGAAGENYKLYQSLGDVPKQTNGRSK